MHVEGRKTVVRVGTHPLFQWFSNVFALFQTSTTKMGCSTMQHDARQTEENHMKPEGSCEGK